MIFPTVLRLRCSAAPNQWKKNMYFRVNMMVLQPTHSETVNPGEVTDNTLLKLTSRMLVVIKYEITSGQLANLFSLFQW